jgi:hypothetical protein
VQSAPLKPMHALAIPFITAIAPTPPLPEHKRH